MCIYIHSAVTDWRHCQGKACLKEAVHCIVHAQGRVVAALADGSLAIFHRNADRNWELYSPRLVQLGRPRRSIRCIIPVFNWLWCGYGNRIYVLDPRTARIQVMTSHPESHVRHMAAAGGGIWISVRLETTLRLLHAETGQPLQEVELEPFISHTFGKWLVSLALNISALGAFGKRLWVGTSGGTIISVPFVSGKQISLLLIVGKFIADTKTSPSAGIPLCAMEQAQISYHGHRDAVRFFASVPGSLQEMSKTHFLIFQEVLPMCMTVWQNIASFFPDMFTDFPGMGETTEMEEGSGGCGKQGIHVSILAGNFWKLKPSVGRKCCVQ
uniref:Uncharacterized protein n=1 Tax=Laticauda laticaudata TaxID=8630 RepID=A0A8C5S3W7_LATLA